MSLPREILKWIQGLSLSFVVKNVKREFSNGFLVAEIMANMFGGEIQMHSFENGLSMKTKKNNWEQLEKIFRKKNLPVTKSMIDDVVNCKENGATAILQVLYNADSAKPHQNVKPNTLVPDVPNYAKPKHMQVRINYPTLKMNQMSKQKKMEQKNAIRPTPVSLSPSLIHPKISKTSINDELNTIVENVMEDHNCLSYLDQKKDFILSFIACAENIPKDCSDAVFNSIRQKIPIFSETILQIQREFWKFFTIFSEGLQLSYNSLTFNETVDVICSLGSILTQKDAALTWNLFQEFAFEKLITLIRSSPLKRRVLLHIVYSFCSTEHSFHLDVIRELQKRLDSNTFLSCLCALITVESDLNQELLDLYVYYSMMGISSSSPILRASSISMLTHIVKYNLEFVTKLLDCVLKLMHDEWWEVKAQLIVFSASLLRYCDPSVHKDEIEKALWVVITILGNQNIPYINMIALSYHATHLKKFPSLLPIYVDLLLGLGDEDRHFALDQDSTYENIFQIGISTPFKLINLPHHWYSFGVFQRLSQVIQHKKIEILDKKYLEIINSCIKTRKKDSNNENIDDWVAPFESISDLLFVGLTQDSLCELTSRTLVNFLKLLPVDVSTKSMTPMSRILVQIYGDGKKGMKKCKEVIPMFLISLYDIGEPMITNLKKMSEEMVSQQLHSTELGEFIEYIGKKSAEESQI